MDEVIEIRKTALIDEVILDVTPIGEVTLARWRSHLEVDSTRIDEVVVGR